MKRSIFSLPSRQLNGQLGPLRAFLAKERPEEGDDRKQKHPGHTGSHPSSIASKYRTLSYSSLCSGNFQRVLLKQPDSHKTTLQSPTPLSSALFFLQEETKLDTKHTGSSSTSLKLLAPSQIHMKHKWKKGRAVTVSVYTSAGAEGRMRGVFHARATLARFPHSAHLSAFWQARGWAAVMCQHAMCTMFLSTLYANCTEAQLDSWFLYQMMKLNLSVC